MLAHIMEQKIPDYTALHHLAKCTPPNHFTSLCQHLCIEGAAQWLLGCVQTIDFRQELEELFWDLEWRLVAKTAKNNFYAACRQPTPHPPMQEACQKVMRKYNNEWTKRVNKYGVWPTAKYFRRRNEPSALYLSLYHDTLFLRADQWFQDKQTEVPDSQQSIWAEFLREDGAHVPNLKYHDPIVAW